MSEVELRVLGPLEILVGGRLCVLEAPKQRSVLTLLAINVGEVQSTDRIIDAVWGEAPPWGGASSSS